MSRIPPEYLNHRPQAVTVPPKGNVHEETALDLTYSELKDRIIALYLSRSDRGSEFNRDRKNLIQDIWDAMKKSADQLHWQAGVTLLFAAFSGCGSLIGALGANQANEGAKFFGQGIASTSQMCSQAYTPWSQSKSTWYETHGRLLEAELGRIREEQSHVFRGADNSEQVFNAILRAGGLVQG